MSASTRLVSDPRTLLAEFERLCEWADEIVVCTARIESAGGKAPAWRALSSAKAKLLVIVSDRTTDRAALDELHRPASLRLIDDPKGRYRPNVYLFRRQAEVRALVGTARLVPSDFASSLTVMVHWQGTRDDTFACELAHFIERCKANAKVPGSGNVVSEETAVVEPTDIAPAPRETRGDDLPFPFLEMEDVEQQIVLAWSILLGLGPLEKSDAVRLVASQLREQRRASFQRLKTAGDLYQAILKTIERGVKQNCFDRPKRGQIRAIQPLAVNFDGPLWETCLLGSLNGDFTTRDQAIRSAADRAVELVGLRFHHLKTGGRIETGLKKAIARLIRRGMVERDGLDQIRKVQER